MNEQTDIKKVAFLVNGEIFHVMHIPQTPDYAGVYEGMLSSPEILDVSDKDFFIEPGTRMIDGEFYVPVSRFLPPSQSDQPDYEVE